MKKILTLLLSCYSFALLFSQDLYFPPLIGNEWESTSPAALGWCEAEIPALYDFLDDTNTKAFLVLKDGKIVLEKYFDAFTQDSIWYWASAGKSLTSLAVGIAQEEGLLDIEEATADYLGAGWTSAPSDKEAAITIRNQLSMSSGLDDADDIHCTDPSCLQYLADAGSRWAYHNGPYTLLSEVLATASGQTFNGFVHSRISSKIGMFGTYISTGYNKIFFSQARSMARYGLLILNNGIWDNTTVLADQNYLQQMLMPSQNINEAYGYLWWLNGSSSYMLPGLQFVFNGPAVPEAPADMVAAMGKNGQFINVVPSQQLLLIRMGENAGDNDLVPNLYNSNIWEKLNAVICNTTAIRQPFSNSSTTHLPITPNPAQSEIQLLLPTAIQHYEVELINGQGHQLARYQNQTSISIQHLAQGWYTLRVITNDQIWVGRFVKKD